MMLFHLVDVTQSFRVAFFVTVQERALKEQFRADISRLVVQLLNPYCKPDCKVGRIASKDDFKFLARKLTFIVLEKELQQKKSCAALEYSPSVRAKTEAFVRSYMKKIGPKFMRS